MRDYGAVRILVERKEGLDLQPNYPRVQRTPFEHKQTSYDGYFQLLAELRQSPPTRPPDHHLSTYLAAFPPLYPTPRDFPMDKQTELSEHRFFWTSSCIYRRVFGQLLYVFPREWIDVGKIKAQFPPQNDDRREMFWRDPATKRFHYLGVFQLVNSEPFPYTLCLSRTNEPKEVPVRFQPGDKTFFFALQFVGWNSKVYDAFSPTPVQDAL